MFFDNKQEFIDKINFFVENEEWHYQKGIPYTLGIGLHGPPGTGKTSLIKCLAVALKRHIVNLNIKLIKTRKQLYEFYYENRYNYENPKKSISFDKKIIIIEDIDCMGDIVAERTLKDQVLESTDNIQQMIAIMKKNDETKMLLPTFINDDPVTLDDILNLWDGIRETPGRVLVITSNHYDKLDKALKRPGRIDISLELSYASHQVISDMYFHFFGKKIDGRLQQIKPHFYTPSEITNIYRSSRLDEEFIARLLKNEKVE
jgi:chaperone BCS1